MLPAQEDKKFTDYIIEKARMLSGDCSLILRFSRGLPRALLRYANTRIVGLLSRIDVFPTTSMEARYYASKAILIAGRTSGLAEQVEYGVDGYTVPIERKARMVGALDKIMSRSNEWEEIVAKGRKKIQERYSLEKNLAAYLSDAVT